MAYILRTSVKHKYLLNGLMSVFGLGNYSSTLICQRLGFQKKFLLKHIIEDDISFLAQLVEELELDLKGDLYRWLKQRIDLLRTIKSYRGIRIKQGLPVRGQRTHTNARTCIKMSSKRRKS